MGPRATQDQEVPTNLREWSLALISRADRCDDVIGAAFKKIEDNRDEASTRISKVKEDLVDKIAEGQKELQGELTTIKVELAMIKTQMALWGGLGAAIPVLLGILYEILSKK